MSRAPAPADLRGDALTARRLLVSGRIQAVGYRPFVYRLAHALGVRGWVRNRSGLVEILAAGAPRALEAFRTGLIERAPPLARPRLTRDEPATVPENGAFEIRPSERGEAEPLCVPPDYFACDDCLRELLDPADRRYAYPFINCTQCGPRYTLIRGLPYDRALTTMAAFPLCADCRREYEDPLDRRFHAEPVACAACGPRLEFAPPGGAGQAPLDAAVDALRAGRILAVKGIGGYHLVCDARNAAAVTRLRERKLRPDKPLAVMVPRAGADGLDWARRLAEVPAEAAVALTAPERSIVLLARRPDDGLAPGIAPGLGEVGLFLPYSPLHELLTRAFAAPVVATSGNLSGEPVLTTRADAEQRLGRVADAFLHHDRHIERPADDAVYRRVAGRFRPLRLGRGTAPLELELPRTVDEPLLAVGGHLKNTIALAWANRAVVSPHIGEMDTRRSLDVFAQLTADLQRLYGVQVRRLACDAHPGYATHRWARAQGLPVTTVWHHHAHASALAAEVPGVADWLVFTWDGVGLGEDGKLWGGEALLGRPGAWRRVASLEPLRLPGGDRAAREPWRSAAAACWAAGHPWQPETDRDGLARAAWERGLNCHDTTAAGRLFDAAACLVLGIEHCSYEGQAPMALEAQARGSGPTIVLPVREEEDTALLRLDWRPLLPMLTDARLSPAERASGFHRSLAAGIAQIAQRVAARHPVERVGLTGGVFQNAVLAAAACEQLATLGFAAVLPERLPANDAGLSFGQLVECIAA